MVNVKWEKLCGLAQAEIEAALADMPKPLRAKAKALPVTLERVPSFELQVDGIEIDTLGLFVGVTMAEEGEILMPAQIILFLENIWDCAEKEEKVFRKEIRTTFLHELGHFFGLDEAELAARCLE